MNYACPFGKKVKSLIKEQMELEVVEWTH
ncbi:hypothetical protein MWH28_12605 [Natroniella sulfidigena]|nr:hypothetical protein [Natroniella sulfidigena]